MDTAMKLFFLNRLRNVKVVCILTPSFCGISGMFQLNINFLWEKETDSCHRIITPTIEPLMNENYARVNLDTDTNK